MEPSYRSLRFLNNLRKTYTINRIKTQLKISKLSNEEVPKYINYTEYYAYMSVSIVCVLVDSETSGYSLFVVADVVDGGGDFPVERAADVVER